MSSGGRGGASSSRVSVSIPHNVRKVIQEIKEMTGHSEEDIYAVFKECNMDFNETIDRLLYLDTFHEVKSKRERRKEVQNVNGRAPEDSRRKPGLQGRGSRGGRGNFPSLYLSHEAGGGRSAAFRKENGVVGNKNRLYKPPDMSFVKEVDTNMGPLPTKNPFCCWLSNIELKSLRYRSTVVAANGTIKASSNSAQAGEVMQLPVVGSEDLRKGDIETSVPTEKSLLPQPVAQLQHAPSASDPVLVPSLDSWPSSFIGAIRREARTQQLATESNVVPAERLAATSPELVDHNQLDHRGSQGAHEFEISGIDKGRLSENSQLSFSAYPVHEHSSSGQLVTAPSGVSCGFNADTVQKPKSVLPSKTISASEAAAAATQVEGNSMSSPLKPSLSLESTLKLETLKISDGEHVIIPNHIQVPEAVKSILSFGSFDASFIDDISATKDSETVKESSHSADLLKDETFEEPSSRIEDSSLIAEDGKFSDQQPPPLKLEEAPLSRNESKVAYDAGTGLNVGAMGDDQVKHELPALGPPYPLVQNTPSYGFGFLPHMIGSPLLQVDGLESQPLVMNSLNANTQTTATSASTPPPIQPPGVGQSSISLPPPLPLFRHPYPHGYIPYSHYYSPFYLPPPVQQYFGHGGFSPQLPTGNMFLQQPGTASGLKVDPASYKPGANSVNAAHVVVPSGYGVFGSSQLGYGPGATITSGNANSNDELSGSSLKETNAYPGQQSEGPSVWMPTAGRETPSFPFNSFLNLPPQGQHATMAPQSAHAAFAAIYSPLQTIPNPAAGHPLLQQSHSQPVAGSLESTGPLPQRQQINWNGGF
ncbi:GBF-interacting protein 1-like protein [Drosera capensis]